MFEINIFAKVQLTVDKMEIKDFPKFAFGKRLLSARRYMK